MMEEMYMDVVMNLLYDIRLKIEGAVELYENDAAPLRRLALENDTLSLPYFENSLITPMSMGHTAFMCIFTETGSRECTISLNSPLLWAFAAIVYNASVTVHD